MMPDGAPASLIPLTALPRLASLPLVGSLPWLYHREGFMTRMLELAERHRDAGAFCVRIPGRGMEKIFVSNASLVRDLVNEERFEKDLDGPLEHIRDFAGDGLFTARAAEPNWHRAHRILSPGFSTSAIERSYPAMVTSLRALLTHWQDSRDVDVVVDMTKLTLDTISLAAFDHRFDSFTKEELHPFLQALARALQESIDVIQRPAFLAPLYARHRARYQADIELMFELVDQVIRERKARPRAAWPADFLSLMLEEADPKTNERLSDKNIRYQILTFLIAGHETTAGLLSFALHQLAREKGLLASVRAEVDAHCAEGMPTMKSVLELDLVRRVLSEALRLWPTVPAVSRRATVDGTMGPYQVRRGEVFGVLVHALHRDPTVWPDPLRFDPDRFLPAATKARPGWAYKPFGIGRRSCTGKHFALVEATLCLAVLVRDFDFDDPGPLTLKPTVSPKPDAFRLRIRPRRRAATER